MRFSDTYDCVRGQQGDTEMYDDGIQWQYLGFRMTLYTS
jgi:hypothetical protein